MEAAPLFEMRGVDLNGAIFGGGNGCPAVELEGGRHHEAFVVIGVLADQVNASGRPIDAAIRCV